MYRFSAQIEPVDVTFDDTWAASHRRFQTEGRIGHGLRDCPYLRRPTLVRRWDPSGWRTLSVPPSFSRKPDASQS